VVTFGTYQRLLDSDFIVYDDDQYVTANPAVRDGLTPEAVRWAFTTGHAANWHPLTWLSHLLDVELYGLNPRGHHLTSLVLHIANTVLLFLVLRGLTGTGTPSLVAAALFGLHPAHVESVAWVAERKDVLSTLLGLLTMAAYGAWARRPSLRRYVLMVVPYGLGLLAKPMLVTLPFVLLLLDLWPLGRFRQEGARGGLLPRLREKLPLFILAAASSVVTFLVQRVGGAVQSVDTYPLTVRCENAVVACAGYLRELVWPSALAVFYPHPGASLSLARVLGSLGLLLLLSAAAWRLRRSQPAVLVGWLWFVGTLVPVIGIVQVGWQAMADRYTYIPSIGLFVALTWGAGALAKATAERQTALAAATGAALAACVFLTRAQVGYWRDSETLFRHALEVTQENFLAHNNLGHYYNERERPADALPQVQEAVRIRPGYSEARTNLGRSLFLLGRLDEAYAEFERAYTLRPDDAVVLNNLGFTRLRQGEIAEAERWYRIGLVRAPDWAELHHRLAVILLMEDRPDEARAHFARAAELDPRNLRYQELRAGAAGQDPRAVTALRQHVGTQHRDLALALFRKGRLAEARDQYSRAVRLNPADAESLNDLGYTLFLDGRLDEAIARYEAALRLRPDLALARSNLAEARRGTAVLEQPVGRTRPEPRLEGAPVSGEGR
jgi:tetratricopeptide (TPR) repeat protein